MFFHKLDGLKLSTAHKTTLQNLTIDERGPGTILHDFDVFLNILKEGALPLTAAEQLPLGVLPKINAQMVYPIQLALKRPQQKSYPHIHGMYLLVRASGLTYVDDTEKKPLLVLEEDVYRQWAKLNPSERYCSLLETWLLRGKPEIIGEHRRPFDVVPENFGESASFYVKIPDEGLPVVGSKDVEHWLLYRPGWHNLGLLDLFGLINIEHALPESGKGWRIKTIHRTALGDALLAVLHSEFFAELSNIFLLEDEGKVPVGALQPVLQRYFPEWKNDLSLPEWTFREGTYTFKVSLGPVWRHIAIGARQSLDDLASIILTSVSFDNDHLYQFSYRNRFGAVETITHPYIEDSLLYTSEVLIGAVPIRLGQTITFMFDYGDNWEFDVTLEQVDSAKAIKKPRILDKHGKSPEQYPSWDDD